jgi:hypothetical protein
MNDSKNSMIRFIEKRRRRRRSKRRKTYSREDGGKGVEFILLRVNVVVVVVSSFLSKLSLVRSCFLRVV